jgi:mycothiol synthase
MAAIAGPLTLPAAGDTKIDMTGTLVTAVTVENAGAFVAYCQAYGAEHDESLLPGLDFVPTADYPAYLLMGRPAVNNETSAEATNPAGVRGAACVIREPSYAQQGIARFMILHAVEPVLADYAALLDALAPHTAGLRYAYGFIPEQLSEVRQIWEQLGLQVERFAYVLEHPGISLPAVELPSGYVFEAVRAAGQGMNDEALAAFCAVLNASFAGQPQHVGTTPEGLVRDAGGPYGLEDGLWLLLAGGQPVATVRVERDAEAGAAAIDNVAVLPAYRGQGLGSLLIRQALRVARGHDLHPVYLAVSATNEAAIRLYAGQGFRKKSVAVAYRWQPPREPR